MKIEMASLPSLPSLARCSMADCDCRSHSFSNTAHWVIPGLLMQGERPKVHQIRKIISETNCRTFVCLQAECLPEEGATLLGDGGVQDWKHNPTNLPAYSNEVRAVTTEIGGPSPIFLHYGVRNMKTFQSKRGLVHLVSDLAKRIRGGETIYLHCWGGQGRSGLVSACLLMKLYTDIDADMALNYTAGFCQLRNVEGKEVSYSSPETEDQKEQVREFCKDLRDLRS